MDEHGDCHRKKTDQESKEAQAGHPVFPVNDACHIQNQKRSENRDPGGVKRTADKLILRGNIVKQFGEGYYIQ